MKINKIMHMMVWALVLTAVSSLLFQSTLAAPLSSDDLESISQDTTFYDKNDASGSLSGCVTNTASGDTAATGSDNQQTAFNFFKTKGLTDAQAAAIVGNLMGESGLQTSANQSSGPGMGIAQWSNPGRWNGLEDFAQQQGVDKFAITTQLAYVWAELNGQAPSGDYSTIFAKFKAMTSQAPPAGFTTVEVGVGFFMGTTNVNQSDSETDKFVAQFGKVDGYEGPGTPHMDNRLTAANDTLTLYGTGDDSGAVSGTAAACGSVSAVDCATSTSGASGDDTGNKAAASSSTLSQVRQNAVCIAQQELAKWKSGSGLYTTYSQGRNEEWCADFVSWVYNQAGYPMADTKDGNVPSVAGVKSVGQQGKKFTYHAAGSYTPIPGDIIVHQSGESHVNMVVAVNSNNHTMTIIGGNQGAAANSQSMVKIYDDDAYSGTDGITGYVSPNDGSTN